MAKTTRIGGPLSPAHEVALRRALAPMIAQAQATATRIKTPAEARALGAALRKAWPDAKLRALVAKAGQSVEGAVGRMWARTDAAADARSLVDQWSKEAAAKISSVRDEVAEGLRKEIVAALEKGTDPAELAERWRVRGLPVAFGTLEGRVKVIANHQLSILHSRVQRERARALGVTHFVWRSQGDDRVRQRHAALDGTKVAYADGAGGEGLPGEPVNCRCWAESIVDASRGPAVGPASVGSSPRQAEAVARATERGRTTGAPGRGRAHAAAAEARRAAREAMAAAREAEREAALAEQAAEEAAKATEQAQAEAATRLAEASAGRAKTAASKAKRRSSAEVQAEREAKAAAREAKRIAAEERRANAAAAKAAKAAEREGAKAAKAQAAAEAKAAKALAAEQAKAAKLAAAEAKRKAARPKAKPEPVASKPKAPPKPKAAAKVATDKSLRDFAESVKDLPPAEARARAEALIDRAMAEPVVVGAPLDPTVAKKGRLPKAVYNGTSDVGADIAGECAVLQKRNAFHPPVAFITESPSKDDGAVAAAGVIKHKGQHAADIRLYGAAMNPDQREAMLRRQSGKTWMVPARIRSTLALEKTDPKAAAVAVLRSTIHHEYGHTIKGVMQARQAEPLHGAVYDRYRALFKQAGKEELSSLSTYAATNEDEFFAESYAAAIAGEFDLVPPRFRNLFRLIAKDES